jgi:hypothetical protein
LGRHVRLDRIENVLVDGMPDTNVCIDGNEFWVELKAPTEPKRASTPLFGSNHRVLQSQKNWMLRQYKAGGKAFFLIATDKRWMLLPGHLADVMNEMSVPEMIRECLWIANDPPHRLEWPFFERALQRHGALR